MIDEAAAYARFLAACRGFWAGPMFRALQRQVATDAATQRIDSSVDQEAFHALVARHPTHAMFGWMERHLQHLKYSGRWGLVPMVNSQRDALLAGSAPDDAILTLDSALQPPAYWLEHDIHQHPGGLSGALAGFVYKAATDQGGVVGRPELHDLFARAALDGRAPRRILDLGCGFGRSTVAFAAAAPNASVVGADLSESCLRLAAAQAPAALRGRLHYRQMDAAAESTAAEASYDLVTSTMLLHELPAAALEAVIAQTGRWLRPGGVSVHLDFLPPADPLLRILYDGHSLRNNEPFMRDLANADLADAHRRAGFDGVEIVPFAEAEGALDMPAARWRLPWTMIVATKRTSQPELS